MRSGSSASQLAMRVDFHPVRRPCTTGELANAASRTGPSSCSAAQRRATSRTLAGVDAHLHGGGRAHHRAPVRADAVERGLHGLVARHVEQSPRRTQRIARPRDGDQALGGQPLADGARVEADGPHEVADARQREAGDLHLPAGLDGDRASRGERGGSGALGGLTVGAVAVGLDRARGGEGGGGVRAEGSGQQRGIEGVGGVVGVADEPLELGADEAWRPVLEAHGGDVGLGGRAVGQRRRGIEGDRVSHHGRTRRW